MSQSMLRFTLVLHYRLVVAGFISRVSYPGSNFKQKSLIGQLELSELKCSRSSHLLESFQNH